MKKILLIFILLTGTLYAQPPIAQPNDLVVCDQNGNGTEVFDLTSTIPEILNGLNPSLYTVRLYTTLTNAQNDVAAIVNPTAFPNITSPQTIYVRVFENANPTNFAITDFDLIVSSPPAIVQPPNIIIYESPFDEVATFDLTQNESVILNGTNPSAVSLTYYESEIDAQSGVNAILNTAAYINYIGNPAIIYVRVVDVITGCFSITNFFLFVYNSEIINIPDVNLKAKLISANSNNNIASSEYYSYSPFFSCTGGDTFNPTDYIVIDTNQDGEIQVFEAMQVTQLNLYNYNLSPIYDLTGLELFTNLTVLNVDNNQITNFNNFQTLNNISYLNCANNPITILNAPGLQFIQELDCRNISILNIDLSFFTNLKSLHCGGLNLLSINLTQNINLDKLSIFNCSISSINLSQNVNLKSLTVRDLPLTSLNLTSNNLLQSLSLTNNLISVLDLSSNNLLCNLEIDNSLISEIDLSNSNLLSYFTCENNINLEYINAKNNNTFLSVFNYPIFLNNPNLIYVCADPNEVTLIQNKVGPFVNVNTYCSFNPGGDYNTITGTIQYDFNNNSCDISDPNANYLSLEVSINGITTNSSAFSNGLGVYSLFATTPGVYGLTPNLENASLFNVTPSPAEVPVMTINNSTVTQNFCITANGVHPDLEVVIAPVIPARPGFEAVYKIVYKNKGNQVMSQINGLNFLYNNNLMSLVSTSVVPSTQAVGGLQWDYANLMPFESRSILVTFLINAPTNISNPVNIDDVLTFTAVVLPQAGDDNVTDNTFVFNQTVVGSYDPNDITCLQGNLVQPTLIGEYLHYLIRFENTGTAPAENIVVKTEIDATQYNINSMQMLAASHNASIKRTGNKIEFIFQNIQLVSGGHGNILLKIKSNGSLVEGDSVTESAAIYFDYNFPVITNDEETVFATLGINNPNMDATISIYPNPVKDVVTIRSASQIQSIQLYDVQGRLLQTMVIDKNEYQFNLSERTNGVYFVKITSDGGVKIEKIIKE
jgi:hypothetical protein